MTINMAIEPHLFQGGDRGSSWCIYEYKDGLVCSASANAHPSPNEPMAPLVELSAPEAAIAFVAHSEAVLALVRKKDAAYGGAWKKQGYMGNLARIMSKASRLEAMMWKDISPDFSVALDGGDADPMAESVMDTLHDLMALAAFMASNLEEGNRWGK